MVQFAAAVVSKPQNKYCTIRRESSLDWDSPEGVR